MGMTYVKSDELTAAPDATAAVEVDLGLGIDEAARILGVLLDVYQSGVYAPNACIWIQGAYSFDPEDTIINGTDDEQFAQLDLVTSSLTAAVEPQLQSASQFFDFTRMNLVTTRNVALLLDAAADSGGVKGKVYYEKFKPSAIELTQLIATRR
ncbi:hypothetical protein ES708_34286 [subsurface metagenome]